MQGRWTEVEKLGVQVMETRKGVLGPEHPDTLMSMWNLSYALKELYRHVEAISDSLLQACVRLQDRLLSPTHPDTVDATADLEAWKNLYSVGSSLSGGLATIVSFGMEGVR